MVKLIDSINLSNINYFIKSLDDKIFKKLRDPKDVECNLLFIQVKNKNGVFNVIKRSNGEVFIPNKSLLKNLSSTIITSSNKLCLFKVNKGYISEQNKLSNISLVLFSEDINSRTKTEKYIICGLIFLKEIVTKTNNNLYIPLICCKPSIGSGFMLLAEKITQDLGYSKLTLNSMADPLGFYIHKGYILDRGNDTYILENPLFLDKYNPVNGDIKTVYQNAAKHAKYYNEKGRLVSHTNKKKTLTKKVSGKLSRSQKKFLSKPVVSLTGIRKIGNEIRMSKKFNASKRNQTYKKK